jgi:hypothetical protein
MWGPVHKGPVTCLAHLAQQTRGMEKMTHRKLSVLGALLVALPGWAATYTVTTDADTGIGSLRYCIERANATGLGDLITFQQAMVIQPTAPLPPLTGPGDTINGDLNDDGHPDVILDGSKLSGGDGLQIAQGASSAGEAPADLLLSPLSHLPIFIGTGIAGLAIMRFPGSGICIMGRGGNSVRGCYIGVTLFGDGARPNNLFGILVYTDGNTIGGTSAKDRNLICSTRTLSGIASAGVVLSSCDNSRVLGNYFGLDWSGLYGIGEGDWHIAVQYGHNNRIGGTETGARNLFGGDYDGLRIYGTSGAMVQGNWFGLGSNGNKAIRMRTHVLVMSGSTQTLVGGPSASARNVFGAGDEGVEIANAGTAGNTVQGNYFGSNAAGTVRRTLQAGVRIRAGAGAQTIGNGNRFTLSGSAPAVSIAGCGANTTVKGNRFGVLGNGTTVGTRVGVSISGVRVFVTGNVFAKNAIGVRTTNATANARIFRNTFRQCGRGVWVKAGLCMMGNLANSATNDDGGNRFLQTNTWHIYNSTEAGLRAEGNDFGTTSRAAINAKIFDAQDDPDKGRVDFIPLIGGVIPTGDIAVAGLTLTCAAAVPTAGGAEIAFTLSAPATVTAFVRNLAGRPVRRLVSERVSGPGLNSLIWDARSDSGLPAPNGAYLVEVTARAEDGSLARALAQTRLRR